MESSEDWRDRMRQKYSDAPDGIILPSAYDVASDIMNNQVSSYDISALMDEATQAECFRELVGMWARRKDAGFSRIDMTDFMEDALIVAAKRNGYE